VTTGPGTTPQPERDHVHDVQRLHRRILALEERLDRAENMRGVIVPKTLTAELERTRRWAREVFTGYGFELPDSAAASPDMNGD
jgi:hypothetical protein